MGKYADLEIERADSEQVDQWWQEMVENDPECKKCKDKPCLHKKECPTCPPQLADYMNKKNGDCKLCENCHGSGLNKEKTSHCGLCGGQGILLK